jgi:hypothetical protein
MPLGSKARVVISAKIPGHTLQPLFKIDARNDHRGSVTAYMECLATHAPKDCEGLRLAMEADERQYNALAADTAGGNSAANINIRNR